MDTDQARETKEELSAVLLNAGALRLQEWDAKDHLSFERPPQPAVIGLGLTTSRRGDTVVAVRLGRKLDGDAPELRLIRQRTGTDVDIRYVGGLRKFGGHPGFYQERRRPVVIGSSVGSRSGPSDTGTLGCFVTVPSGEVRMVSNNHVLARENAGEPDDEITQPGPYDRGGAQDIIACLRDYAPLGLDNTVDCASAEMAAQLPFEPERLNGDVVLKGVHSLELGDDAAVHKIGRTTGHTRGRITAVEADILMEYGMGELRFRNQIEIHADEGLFSRVGDSGSLVYTDAGLAVGLLIGGNENTGASYANLITPVLDTVGGHLLVG